MRRERRYNGENVTVPVADDAFHDGTDVLPEVREWHDHLRSVLRVSDTITGRILNIVDEHMLVAESVRQSRTISVNDALQEELRLARKDYKRLVSKGIVKPVAESVKEALLSVESQENTPANSQVVEAATTNTKESLSVSSHSSLAHPQRHQLKSSRINKQKRMYELPTGRVAHRQDALRPQTNQHSFIIETEHAEPSYAPNQIWRPHPGLRSTPSAESSSSRATKTPKISTEKEPIAKGSSTSSSAHRSSAHSGYRIPLAKDPRPENLSSSEYSLAPQDGGRIPMRMNSEERAARAPIPLSLEIPRSHTIPPVPFHVDPSWPIAQEREVERNKEKGVRARFGFGKKQDEYLKQFLVERDIVSQHGIL